MAAPRRQASEGRVISHGVRERPGNRRVIELEMSLMHPETGEELTSLRDVDRSVLVAMLEELDDG